MSDFKPSDKYPRAAAKVTNSSLLTRDFCDAETFGDMEMVAAVAIARCAHLEHRRERVDEHRVRAEIYPFTGNVYVLPPRKTPKDDVA